MNLQGKTNKGPPLLKAYSMAVKKANKKIHAPLAQLGAHLLHPLHFTPHRPHLLHQLHCPHFRLHLLHFPSFRGPNLFQVFHSFPDSCGSFHPFHPFGSCGSFNSFQIRSIRSHRENRSAPHIAEKLSNLNIFSAEKVFQIHTFSAIIKNMKRKMLNQLIAWKTKDNRKPLIIWGARQVGKTWLMKEFGKQYFSNHVYISFYNNTKIAKLFEPDFDTKRIINSLEVQYHTEINPNETLLIFDEIQEAPKVLESLKYFYEEAPEYYIVCAGSLLGVKIHNGVSFPVGKVKELHLYPMDFSEYLTAMKEERLAQAISNPQDPLLKDLRDNYIENLKNYYYVGGMPECVQAFSLRRDYSEIREIQNSILSQYEGDFGKHIEPKELPRIRMVWNALPVQLAKENKKFFFGQIKSGARIKDFEIAIQWLVDAGLIYKIHKVTKPAIPLKSYIDFSSFKIFMLDIGLFAAMSELDSSSIINGNEIFVEFKGALSEQFVLQQIISSTTYTPYYYAGDKSVYETDFLIQKEGGVAPIEVKSDENTKSKSLRAFYDKFHPQYAIRLSTANSISQDWMSNIPLWAIEGM